MSYKSINDINIHINGNISTRRKVNARCRRAGNLEDTPKVKINIERCQEILVTKKEDHKERKRKLMKVYEWDFLEIPVGFVNSQVASIETGELQKKAREDFSNKTEEMCEEGVFIKPQLASLLTTFKAANAPIKDSLDCLRDDFNSFQTKTYELLTAMEDEINELKANAITKSDVVSMMKQQGLPNADANKEEVFIKALKYSESRIVVIGLDYTNGNMAEAKKLINEFLL